MTVAKEKRLDEMDKKSDGWIRIYERHHRKWSSTSQIRVGEASEPLEDGIGTEVWSWEFVVRLVKFRDKFHHEVRSRSRGLSMIEQSGVSRCNVLSKGKPCWRVKIGWWAPSSIRNKEPLLIERFWKLMPSGESLISELSRSWTVIFRSNQGCLWVCSQYHKGKGDPQKTYWEVSVDGGSKAKLGWIWQREHNWQNSSQRDFCLN